MNEERRGIPGTDVERFLFVRYYELAERISIMEKTKKKHKWLKRIVSLLLVVLLVMAGFVGGIYYAGQLYAGGGKVDNAAINRKLNVLNAYINRFYIDKADNQKIADSTYAGYMSGLGDPYSVYYTKSEYDQMNEDDSGSYQGIGIQVLKDENTGYILVDQVFKDEPAYKAGVKAKDLITQIDGKDTSTLTLTDAVRLIRGSDKKKCVLTIFRDQKLMKITVEKSKIQIDSVTYEMKANKIGYIEVSQFIEDTDEQFDAAVDDLTKQGMKGMIVDLRDDGGGLLDSCVNMVSRILPKDDLIVYTMDKNKKKTNYKSNSSDTVNVPICVLVNGNSASASEIFTGALKDHKKATIVGSKTFGKGIVQNIFPLSDGSAIKLTVSKYYTPSGSYIHKKGIQPDIKVDMTEKQWAAAKEDPAKDPVLKKAVETIEEGKAR
ncbi:MAG: S41 family peptidase [Lachnospiraceae bacterium]|nr:S41 family peptidase [Lachnospiraceae bacterium]